MLIRQFALAVALYDPFGVDVPLNFDVIIIIIWHPLVHVSGTPLHVLTHSEVHMEGTMSSYMFYGFVY